MKILLAVTLLVFFLASVQGGITVVRAVCDFGNGVGLSGSVDILQTADGITLDFSGVSDSDTVLSELHNAIHIHKLGFDDSADETCDASFTSGHFNPVENYGEMSCVNGYFDAADLSTLMWEQPAVLAGANGILGRSLVVHNTDGARVGCCNIELSVQGDLLGEAPGYDISAVCGPVTLSQNDTHFWLSTEEASVVIMPVQRRSDCVNATGLATLDLAVDAPLIFNVDEESLMGNYQWAGTSMQFAVDGGEVSCCTVVIKTAVANCPEVATPCDTAVSPCIYDPTAEMTSAAMTSAEMTSAAMTSGGDEETGFSVSVLASVGLLFAALF
jgi:hypothetical protein